MVHLKRCSGCTPRKPSGWDWGGNKTYCLSGRLCSPNTWSPELAREEKREEGDTGDQEEMGMFMGTVQNASPTESVPLRSTQKPEPEWLRPEKCTQPRTRFRQFPCRATWSLSSVDWESTCTVSWGKHSMVHTLRALPTHASNICLQCSFLPTALLNVSLNK